MDKAMNNLSMYATDTESDYFYSPNDLSRDVMRALIDKIANYDPIFRQKYKELFGKLPDVLRQDSSAIKQCNHLLAAIGDEVTAIKTKSISTRDEIARSRDTLHQHIRNINSELQNIAIKLRILYEEEQKIRFQIRTTEKEVERLSKIMWVPITNIPLAFLLLQLISQRNETLAVLEAKREYQKMLNRQISSNQQLLQTTTNLADSNQRLTHRCDSIKGNIDNVQAALQDVNISLAYVESELRILQLNWLDLMSVVNNV